MGNLEVKIYTPKKGGDFYVYLYDTESQEVIKKFYKGINIYPDSTERLSAAEDLAKAVEGRLKVGWKPKKKSALPALHLETITIGQACFKAIELMKPKNLSDGTIENYKSAARSFNKIVKVKKWDKEALHELKPHHVETILSTLQKDEGWSNTTYNNNRTILNSMFKILKKKSYIKENVILDTSALKKDSKRPYVPLTPEEQTKVVNHFNRVLPNYNIWLKTLYHTGLRPGELRKMTCSMVRLNGGDDDLLILPEELIKTDRKRIVPVPQDLKNDLMRFDLSNPDYYVFGRWKRRGGYTIDDFKPSPVILGTNTGNHVWKKEVIDTLGIKKYQYSNKHKKANDSIEDGVNIEAVQKLFGHSTPITTEIYAQILELVNFRKIKDKARDYK